MVRFCLKVNDFINLNIFAVVSSSFWRELYTRTRFNAVLTVAVLAGTVHAHTFQRCVGSGSFGGNCSRASV